MPLSQMQLFLILIQNRLQFFEYDYIFVNCEDLDFSSEWRVMRKLKEDPTNTTQWETAAGSITIKLAFPSDSGEYWCENEEGEKSNSVNITFTGIYQLLTKERDFRLLNAKTSLFILERVCNASKNVSDITTAVFKKC